jgi:hypothetical protein
MLENNLASIKKELQ